MRHLRSGEAAVNRPPIGKALITDRGFLFPSSTPRPSSRSLTESFFRTIINVF